MIDVNDARDFAAAAGRVAKAIGVPERTFAANGDEIGTHVYKDDKITVQSEYRTSRQPGTVPTAYSKVSLSDGTLVFHYFHGNIYYSSEVLCWRPGKWEVYFAGLLVRCQVREAEREAERQRREKEEHDRKFGPVDDSHIFG